MTLGGWVGPISKVAAIFGKGAYIDTPKENIESIGGVTSNTIFNGDLKKREYNRFQRQRCGQINYIEGMRKKHKRLWVWIMASTT